MFCPYGKLVLSFEKSHLPSSLKKEGTISSPDRERIKERLKSSS